MEDVQPHPTLHYYGQATFTIHRDPYRHRVDLMSLRPKKNQLEMTLIKSMETPWKSALPQDHRSESSRNTEDRDLFKDRLRIQN